MSSEVPLAEALASLRSELHDAIAAASGDRLKLRVEGIDVELVVEVANKAKAEVGATLWTVVTGKLTGEHNRTRGHRVTLRLKPEWLEGDGSRRDIELSSESPDDNE
ncbi:MAG TPA: trypco2 family protein [Phytomonospora sp.]